MEYLKTEQKCCSKPKKLTKNIWPNTKLGLFFSFAKLTYTLMKRKTRFESGAEKSVS